VLGQQHNVLFQQGSQGTAFVPGRKKDIYICVHGFGLLVDIPGKAAVKGNQKLSATEADALIAELLQLENPYNCPHGRPTIISMTKYELEKKFKRIV
jgi:hypothetical protein